VSRRTRPTVTPPGLTIGERLVLGWLITHATARAGAHVDMPGLARCVCLPPDSAACLDALASRQLLRSCADGRVVLTRRGGGGQ
jgi:hypothetical protein